MDLSAAVLVQMFATATAAIMPEYARRMAFRLCALRNMFPLPAAHRVMMATGVLNLAPYYVHRTASDVIW